MDDYFKLKIYFYSLNMYFKLHKYKIAHIYTVIIILNFLRKLAFYCGMLNYTWKIGGKK